MPASLAVRAVVMRTGTAGGGEAARGAAVAGATAAAAAVGAGPADRSAGAQPPSRTPTAASRPARRVTVPDMALPLRRLPLGVGVAATALRASSESPFPSL